MSTEEADWLLPGLAGRAYVVVGGASAGVGGATTSLLASSGAEIVIIDQDEERLEEAVRSLAIHVGLISTVRADVTKDSDLEDVRAAVSSTRWPLAGLVNVVGGVAGPDWGHFLDLTEEQWDRSHALNLRHVFRMSQIVGRVMARHGNGSIVNLSVIDSLLTSPWSAHYGAMRAGVNALTKTIAVELGPIGIRANTVAWGLIGSPRAHSTSSPELERDVIPLGRRGSVLEVAQTIVFLLSSWSRYLTGQTILVDGGLSARTAYAGARDNIPVFLESHSVRSQLSDSFARVLAANEH